MNKILHNRAYMVGIALGTGLLLAIVDLVLDMAFGGWLSVASEFVDTFAEFMMLAIVTAASAYFLMVLLRCINAFGHEGWKRFALVIASGAFLVGAFLKPGLISGICWGIIAADLSLVVFLVVCWVGEGFRQERRGT